MHSPLRSLVCCVDIGTGARSAAKMSTACLRRFVEGGRNGLWPRNRERFFRGPHYRAFNLPCFNEDANCEYRGRRQLARVHSHKAHLGAHHVCLLRRSHRQHQKALFVRGPFVGWDSFGSRRCGHRGTWKNNSLASFERPIYRGIPAPLSLSLRPFFPLSCCLSTLHRCALWPACSIVHPPLLKYG